MDKFTILSDEFKNEQTGDIVQGVTIIVDGKIKDVMDLLVRNNANVSDYIDVVRVAFIEGLNSMVKKTR